MPHFLISKTFYGVSLLTIAFGLFLYFIDVIAEQTVSYFWGESFYYVEHPFLKLIYLLIIFISFALFHKLNQSEKLEADQKTQSASSYVLTLIVVTCVGFFIHLFFVIKTMQTENSLYTLEQNVLLYYLTDFALVLGFILAGLRLRKFLH